MANRAVADAGRLSTDLRCLDPAEVWRTLARWGSEDPVRLIALAFAAVAMTPDDRPHRGLLAWIDGAAPAFDRCRWRKATSQARPVMARGVVGRKPFPRMARTATIDGYA